MLVVRRKAVENSAGLALVLATVAKRSGHPKLCGALVAMPSVYAQLVPNL
jgi:hypothetical protein